MKNINLLRNSVNNIDEKIVHFLDKRLVFTEKINRLKEEANLPLSIVQTPERSWP